MATKKKKVAKKSTKRLVDRKFLLNLANSIYNPKTRKFLRLCAGTLQNGPDPEDEERPMHCGLGELYFAMTGKQPETTGVSEEDVVDLAVKLSPLKGQKEKAEKEKEAKLKAEQKKLDRAIALLDKLDLPNGVGEDVIGSLENAKDDLQYENEEDEEWTDEHTFREILDSIPGANDSCADGNGSNCSVAAYRERAIRVAEKLRAAANVLAS